MRSLLWGLGAGLLAATAVAFGPVIVIALRYRDLQEFSAVGGVPRYLAWAYTAGALGGLTVGLLRPVTRSGFALRTACGLVLAEVFALQPLILSSDGAMPTSVGSEAAIMGTLFFAMGFVFGPLMIAGFRRTWPKELLNWGAAETSDGAGPSPPSGPRTS